MKLPKFLRKEEKPRITPHQQETLQRRMAEAMAEYNARPSEEHSEDAAQAFMQETTARIAKEVGLPIFCPPHMEELENRAGEIVSVAQEGGLVPKVAAAVWRMSGYGEFAIVQVDQTDTGESVYSLTDIATGRSCGYKFTGLKSGAMLSLGTLAQAATPEMMDEQRAKYLMLEGVS